MQDNYEHEFDEQYISQAWAQMRQLLDREMPVEEKRRPYFLLWWLAGALAFALAAWSLYSLQSGPAPVRSITSFPIPIAGATIPPQPVQNAGPEPIRPLPSPAALSVSKEQETAATTNRSLSPASTPPTEKTVVETSLTAETATAGTPASTIPPMAYGPAPEKLPFLPALPTSLPILATAPHAAGLTGHAANMPGLARIAAEGGVFAHQFAETDGHFAGLFAELHPRHSRFYVRAGASWRLYTQDIVLSDQLLSLENSRAEGNPSSTGLLAARSVATQYNCVGFPVHLGYKTGPRLAFEAGLQGNLLIGSKRRDTWRLAGGNSLPHAGADDDALLYSSEPGNANAELRPFVVEAQAGIAYFPAYRLALRLQYQYALSDLLLSPYREEHYSGLQLSLAYYLRR